MRLAQGLTEKKYYNILYICNRLVQGTLYTELSILKKSDKMLQSVGFDL